jgi:hypothetical protein
MTDRKKMLFLALALVGFDPTYGATEVAPKTEPAKSEPAKKEAPAKPEPAKKDAAAKPEKETPPKEVKPALPNPEDIALMKKLIDQDKASLSAAESNYQANKTYDYDPLEHQKLARKYKAEITLLKRRIATHGEIVKRWEQTLAESKG